MKYSMIKRALCALMLSALPLVICAQDWQSTSSLRGSGSVYTPQVTAVGAVEAQQQATTTASYSPAKSSKPRKSEFGQGQDGGYQDPNSPIGDAWPLAVFAAMFAIVIAIKRHSIDPKKK